METQAPAPAPAQAQTPVHPIHAETATHEALTKWVSENPDNDPHTGTDLEAPKAPEAENSEPEVKAEEPEETPTIELDEDAPIFDMPDMDDKSKTIKVSLKQLREERMMKADYMRNIQKVKAQEAEVQQKVQQAGLAAQQEYLQRLEQHKQLVLKTVAPELQNIDLNKLSMEDPAEAQRIFFKQIQLNQTLQSIEHEQRQAVEKFQQEQMAARARAVEKARETLKTDISGWSEELYGKVLGSMVQDYGLAKEGVTQVAEAELIKVFHDAYQYRQLQKAKPEISKKVVAVPKVVKPGSADKPTSSTAADEAANRLKKSGRGEDFVEWYLAQQKQQQKRK